MPKKSDKYDLLLKGGTLVDPSQGIHRRCDVALAEGKVVAVADSIPAANAAKVEDVSGKIVVPGLVDIHGHFYHGFMPWSIDPDQICPPNGVTTAVDGGSAGWVNFGGLRDFVTPRSRTRLYYFLNICANGLFYLPNLPELGDISLADPVKTAECIEKCRDIILGVKLRIATDAEPAANVMPAMRSALDAAKRARCPVMLHISASPVPVAEYLDLLRPGDIVSHIFNGGEHNILDGNQKVRPQVRAAEKRGVIFDVCYGRIHLVFDVARVAMEQDLMPRVLSSDITIPGAARGHSLLDLMSTFLALGLSLDDVVRCNTVNAATAIGKTELGTLRPGSPADVAVLQVEEGDFVFTDARGKTLNGKQRLSSVMTIRGGEVVYPSLKAVG